MAVLVPGRLVAVAGRLAEHVAAPEDDVRADQLFHRVEDLRVLGQCQEVGLAAHAFVVGLPAAAGQVRADQLFRTHAGVVADQPVERFAQAVDLRGRQAQRGHQVALVVVLPHFGVAEPRHGRQPRRNSVTSGCVADLAAPVAVHAASKLAPAGSVSAE